jgi:DNA-binding NarL/FixJ family response regulator
MSQLPHPINNSNIDGQQINSRPQVVLLTEKQWLHVKKRYNMTPREFQIAKFVCHGLGNEEIAEKLNIMPGTVKTHIRNIYRKTWVHNKISMLLRFIEDSSYLSS